MKVQTIKEFVIENGILNVNPSISESKENKYPFMTFLKPGADGKSEAINVFFSKSAATGLTTGSVVDREFMKKLNVAHVVNAKGEARIKLVLSKYVSIADLLD